MILVYLGHGRSTTGQLVTAFRVDSKGGGVASGQYVVPIGIGPDVILGHTRAGSGRLRDGEGIGDRAVAAGYGSDAAALRSAPQPGQQASPRPLGAGPLAGRGVARPIVGGPIVGRAHRRRAQRPDLP